MIQLAQILFILSVLVILHEFGHYITARMFKMRVEKFYLFMDAGFSLLKKKIGDTEWGIGWLPLGGYVKISGMIDESMDTEQMNSEPQPWEFRSKPAWQRLIVMLGGIIVNILLAWFIYSVTYSTTGKKVISTEKVQENGLAFGEVGNKVGFKNGDKIISIDGKKYDDFKFVTMAVLFGDKVEIERNGKKVELLLTDEEKGEIIKKEGRGFVAARTSINGFFVDSIGRKDTGIERFDQIIGADNKKFTYSDELSDVFRHRQNDTVELILKRDGKEVLAKVKIDSTGKTGINTENVIISFNLNLKSAVIGTFSKDSQAEKAGVKFDDKILSVNHTPVNDLIDFKKQLDEIKPNGTVELTLMRNNKEIPVKVALDKNKKMGIGFSDKQLEEKYIERHKMTLGNAIPEAISQTWDMFAYNINSFKLILRPKTGAIMQVKSPIGIARQLPDTWDWEFIWNFTALFSIGLAFMNLLPIPGLDGGHALFTIVEMVTGKKLNDKAAGYVQTVGMIILLSLMAFTFGKDIYQWVMEVISKK
ncbi:site-2 protease family protein [Flavobacterium amniphilum]|uniref:site-2 protease family protein n=1 Tax=Flavobacterium amniphilum TaxID=1834035 RepID=UPI002029C8F6|nr:site-2 protease family protein [Flavobacterium amniphilum]MCL9803983.1 site-2 protease family protein [Flavobacterium amniphilum]